MHNLCFDEFIKIMKPKVVHAIHLMILEEQHQQSINQQNKTQARKNLKENKCKIPHDLLHMWNLKMLIS